MMRVFVNHFLMVVSLWLIAGSSIRAQDAIFSQHYASPLYLNPAFTGTGAGSRVILNYRNQPYPKLGTLSTINFSYDTDIPSVNSGLGLIVTSDHQGGLIMRNNISVVYAYHLQAGENLFVNFGAQAGYYRKDLNWNNLTFADPTEPPPDETWSHSPNFAAGILVYSDWYYGGFSAHHLNRPRESFYGNYKLPIKYTAHLGMFFEPTRQRRANTLPFDYFISPNVILQNQGDFYRINYGFYSGIESIMAGVWYRQDLTNPNTIIFLIGLTVDNYRIGYSYDYSLSGYSGITHGAHELSLSIYFYDPKRNLRDRILNCPRF
jgi:type IX secretion system PorP/SprF family membrane protein